MGITLKQRVLIDNLANSLRHMLPKFSNRELDEALKSIGIDVRYFVDKELDGFLKWDSERKQPIISVNAKHSLNRRNFSMAHELGHLVIDWNWIPFNKNISFDESKVLNVTKYRGATGLTNAEKTSESLSNEFAAAFLLSNDDLKSFIFQNQDLDYVDLINKVATTFVVSSEVANIRLKNFLEIMNEEESS